MASWLAAGEGAGRRIAFSPGGQLRCRERGAVEQVPPARLDAVDADAPQHLRDDRDPRHDHGRALRRDAGNPPALLVGLPSAEGEDVDGVVVPLDVVESQLGRLAALPVEERGRVPGVAPGRGPVIVAGIAIVAEVLRRVGVDSVEASRRDLLDGAALAAAELPARAEGDAPPGAFTCC